MGKPAKIGKYCLIDKNIFIDEDTIIGNYVFIEGPANIGKGCFIGNYTHIRPHVFIGDKVQIRDHCLIEPHVKIGSGTIIHSHVSTCEGLFIDEDCFIAGHAAFANANIVRSMTGVPMPTDPPYLENNVTVFSHAVILPGVKLRAGCTIGAGSIVTHNTKPNKKYIGIPGKVHD